MAGRKALSSIKRKKQTEGGKEKKKGLAEIA